MHMRYTVTNRMHNKICILKRWPNPNNYFLDLASL
jgi:hypothetical protein